jgi:g-D-glutamyl-meso-diaminopimelate peptidase
MSKWFAKLMVCIMMFSCIVSGIPLQPVQAEEHQQEEKTSVYIVLKEDVPLFDQEENQLGTLVKEAKVPGVQIENELYVDWFGTFIQIDHSYVKELSEGTETIERKQSTNVVTANEPLVVEMIEGEQIATIEKGVSFPIEEELESSYIALLFGQEVSVIKTIGEEEAQDEMVEKTEEIKEETNEETKEDEQELNNKEEEKAIQPEEDQAETDLRKEELAQTVKVYTIDQFNESDRFFQVTVDMLPVYEKSSSGKLIEIGMLKKSQVYQRTNDFTSWHGITIGNKVAYVPKEGTTPATGSSINNKVGSLESKNQYITFNVNTAVYDNSSGKNVHFATVNRGLRLPILREYTSWYAISLSGRIGYVQKKNVEAEFSESIKYFEVTDDNVVGYQKVNGKLVEVTNLMKGQVYPRVADYTSWHEIKYGNGTIFVKKDGTRPASASMIKNENNGLNNSQFSVTITRNTYVYDNTGSSLVEFAELYSGNKYPIISDLGNWIKVDLSGRIGYIRKSDTAIEFSENIHYFSSSKANVAVYDNSSGSLKVVGYLRSGEVYRRTKDYTSWHEIQFGNHRAYVSKDETIPVLSQTYRNPADLYRTIGTFKTTKLTAIYYYVGKDLVPFATIGANVDYSIVEDRGSYIKVNFADRYGFVKKSQVTIKSIAGKDLVNPRVEYSYVQMSKDIDEIINTYPGLATKHVIGKSVDGRNLYAVKLGKGSTEIMINASHHAREHMTTNIVMEMLDQYAQSYVKNVKIDGYAVKSILDRASIWFVPMVNPDGVTLVQKGHTSAKNPSQVLKINGGKTDFSAWKANIRGVDLNRQYPAGWSTIVGDTGKPSPHNYKGPKPLSEPESKAMYDFTNGKDFKTAVSYHSSGEILYWHYKQGTERTSRDREIANMINSKTGYKLVAPKENPSGGGFTDWFISEHLKPGYTPEISPYVGERPVPLSSFDSIWAENKAIGVMLADEAYKNRNSR